MKRKFKDFDYVGYGCEIRGGQGGVIEYGYILEFDAQAGMYYILPCAEDDIIYLPECDLISQPFDKQRASEEIRRIITERAERDIPSALDFLGYSCYGGNEIFSCDWERSRDCFLRLIEHEDVEEEKKCQYANTLGYIYYYGRCSGGVPDYKSAFLYYSMGAAGGMYQSYYKLADMYMKGNGVPRNTHVALRYLKFVYNENIKLFLRGDYECQFADAALRMGNTLRGSEPAMQAYYYYTLADFAIRKRLPFNHYGDGKVFDGIQRELAAIREKMPLKKAGVISSEYFLAGAEILFGRHSCRVTVKPLKSGLSIKIKRLPSPEEEYPLYTFECYPEYGYCRMICEKTIKATGVSGTDIKDTLTFIADGFSNEYDHTNDSRIISFSCFGAEVFAFNAKRLSHSISENYVMNDDNCGI